MLARAVRSQGPNLTRRANLERATASGDLHSGHMIAMDDLSRRRIAVYARYSSALQNAASIDDQVRRCRQFVETRGGSVGENDVYSDAAVSGASLARAGFVELMNHVRAKRYDVVVTEDVSRVTRDLADGSALFRELQYLDVQLLGVADGVDTAAKHGKLSFTVKNLLSDMYLDDLRDKTLRGLEGRALSGFSAGGLPYGYFSVPNSNEERSTGRVVKVDPEAARVVRDRIFGAYAAGRSLDAIAQQLNADGVPPPRAASRHRRKGWIASTIRAMLHNESYVGRWSFKKKEWRKVPGTNNRRYRRRDECEVIRKAYEQRRIISDELWADVPPSRSCEGKDLEPGTPEPLCFEWHLAVRLLWRSDDDFGGLVRSLLSMLGEQKTRNLCESPCRQGGDRAK